LRIDRATFTAIVKVHLVHDNITEELSLEDYVLGVMGAEGTLETEPEALKALAIAIRTYGVKNAGRHKRNQPKNALPHYRTKKRKYANPAARTR